MLRGLPFALLLLATSASAQDAPPPAAPEALDAPLARRLRAARRPDRSKRVPEVRLTRFDDGTPWVTQEGFPALRDDGRVLAVVAREIELCGTGSVYFLTVRSGEVVGTLPLPIEEIDDETCVVHPEQLPPIARALRRFHTLRGMTAVDRDPDGDPAWWVGRGVAVHGPTATVYGLASGRRLGRVAEPEEPLREWADEVLRVARVDAGRYAVVVQQCACRCGVSTELRTVAPPSSSAP